VAKSVAIIAIIFYTHNFLAIIFYMASIVQRIKEFADAKNLSIRTIEGAIGASNGTIGKALKGGTDIQASWLEKIVAKYEDLNPAWLLTGKGSILLETAGNVAPNVAANGNGGSPEGSRLDAIEKEVKALGMKLDAYIKGTGRNDGKEK
jgi:transcriptional regulator with XRE-family HTH domain